MAEQKKQQGKAATHEQVLSMDEVLKATEQRLMARPEIMAMKMENESIMSECRVHPRDLAEVKAKLQDLIENFPEFAEDAIYCKPVGKNADGEQTYATGLSIRAAEALAEAFGYNRVRADVTPLDSKHVKIDATFTDFQSGRIWQDGGMVSKFYKSSGGVMKEIADDRFYSLTVKAEKAKLVREVITRSVNPALKAWFENECNKVQATTVDAEKCQEIAAKFKETHGVTLVQLEEFVGRAMKLGWTNKDVAKLRGIFVAIRDGDVKKEEVFPPEGAAGAEPPKGKDAKDKVKGQAKDVARMNDIKKQIIEATSENQLDRLYESIVGPDSDFSDAEQEQIRKLVEHRTKELESKDGS